MLTARITEQGSVLGLLDVMTDAAGQQQQHLNTIHVSAACRVLVHLQKQQQGLQLDTAELLQLLEQLVWQQLQAAAAGAAAGASTASRSSNASGSDDSSSSSSSSSSGGVSDGETPVCDARSLATVVYSWGKLQHKPDRQLLELLLDALLDDLQQQQQQQQQTKQSAQQVQQQQQRQQYTGDGASDAGASSSSSSSSSSSGSSVHAAVAGPRATCRILSNLCWGLSRLGYTCNCDYNSSSSSSRKQQQQQQLLRQQQYWRRLAELTLEVAPTAATGRDLSSLCYGFAAGGCISASLVFVLVACTACKHKHMYLRSIITAVYLGVFFKNCLVMMAAGHTRTVLGWWWEAGRVQLRLGSRCDCCCTGSLTVECTTATS
jgi:hypothetical protein